MSITSSSYNFGTPQQGLGQPDWTIHDNGYGLLEGSYKMFYNHTNQHLNSIPRKGQQHPQDARLYAYDVSTTYGKMGIAYCEAKYVGIANGSTTEVEWSISGNTSDESIQFHPDFKKFCKDAIPSYTQGQPYPMTAGSGNVNPRLTGVILDAKGLFEKFAPEHPTVPAIEQFVSPAMTVECTFYTKNSSTALAGLGNGLGHWCSKPPFAPEILTASPVNWLLTSCSVQPYGSIYKVAWTFTLSTLGKPHNDKIYKEFNIS